MKVDLLDLVKKPRTADKQIRTNAKLSRTNANRFKALQELEERMQVSIPIAHPITPLIVRYAVVVVSKLEVKKEIGIISYQSLLG